MAYELAEQRPSQFQQLFHDEMDQLPPQPRDDGRLAHGWPECKDVMAAARRAQQRLEELGVTASAIAAA